MSEIELRNVSFNYPGSNETVLEDISLEIEKGEFVCLLGPSGCGKSTLLSLLEGLNTTDRGEILVKGKPIQGPDTDRAVVFQHYSLFPWLSARKNIIFGIRQSGQKLSQAQIREKADYYLEEVGLSEAAGKYPAELSGGMQQRVAIARALAMDADILLMDEPFGAIDPKLRAQLQELVSALCREHGKTAVFVTHDIDEAMVLADRIVVMEPKKIRSIEQVGLPYPRKRDDLIYRDDIIALRKKLMSYFYERVAREIDSGVVL